MNCERTSTNYYHCDISGCTFDDKRKLERHFKHKHLNNLKCNVCGKTYKSINNLRFHLKLHFDESCIIICDICGRSVNKRKIKRHLERHKPIKPVYDKDACYPCRFCSLTFDKINNRTSHEARIHKNKSNFGLETFKCEKCQLVFLTKEELRSHSFEHFEGKIHACDFPGCDRFFKKGKLLTIHKRCHFEPQFKCSDCGRFFVQDSGLKKHKRHKRCPTIKKSNDKPKIENHEKFAILAKEQFISLNGKLNNNTSKSITTTDENTDVFQEKNDHVDENTLNPNEFVAIKMEPIDDPIEEWQYEFLDEAFSEVKKNTSDLCIFVESIDLNVADNKNETKQIKLNKSNARIEPKVQVIKVDKFQQTNFHFICDICGKSNIRQKNILLNHMLCHIRQNNRLEINACDEKDCKMIFSSRKLLIKHKRGYHRVKVGDKKITKPYVCDYCNKEYWARSSIVTHLLVTHKEMADFKCRVCSKRFKSHGNLMRHVRTVHLDKKSCACEKCGAMFNHKYQLEIHIHSHDEPVKCDICGKMVSNIKVHIRNHAKKSNYKVVKCPMCDKMIGKYQLDRHIKAVHEKQYQCDGNKVNLKIYSCKDCGKLFSRCQELRQHEYINHSKSKIYECATCGKYFKTLKLFNVHRFSHQPQNVACEYCDNVYARRGALWKHQKKKHPEIVLKKKAEENSMK